LSALYLPEALVIVLFVKNGEKARRLALYGCSPGLRIE
jgi:hypothetical protein